ncbi:helix-turn-helix transcriptional regulator [Algoriphagus aquimarinus]|uniref:WYL domain-containing protein n=1 Tax=Algoriphagus aquimarinus TaxID=237018 RepID=A0A5C7B4H1_9BACT|nr:WYL domain-containing protein [Algoriphagus aquimarinus]TXE13485.1 WYL domain-containing protein [Algoriphagus aquimarinus]
MAIFKHPFGRYQIIDRELCRKDWVKTSELVKIIRVELSIDVSNKTINNDINAMRYDSLLGYFAPIEEDKRNKAYFYSDKNYTIKAFGLKDGDINALKFFANTLNQYKEYEVFKDFSNAIEKVLDAVKIRGGLNNFEQAKNVVQTEQTPKLSGSELIPLIVQSLNEGRKIQFEYKKFDEFEAKVVQLEPHLLKEDRHRWYVLGRLEKYNDPTTTYALDRMISVQLLEEKFNPVNFDFEEYYRYSFGITVTNMPHVEVILSFTATQGKYLKTLKIHPTQTEIIDNDNEYRISIKVKPSWEFYEKILGYGNTVKIISPDLVVEEFKERLRLMNEQY